MKKFLFIATLLWASVLSSKAQSGLQFNQALFLPVSFSTAGGAVSVGTVPSGKVWKLEQVISSYYAMNNYSFQFNGSATNIPIPSGSADYAMNNNSCWWPAGTSIKAYIASASNASTLYFNILEFNVGQ